jgi:chloramphenicol 3-O-phosphotransferase
MSPVGILRSSERLIAELRSRCPEGKPSLIVIDGTSGAGKTSLADLIAHRMRGSVLHLDYYLEATPPEFDKSCLRKHMMECRRNSWPTIFEGICARAVLKELGAKPDIVIYVKRIDSNGSWLDEEVCSREGIARREALGKGPPADVTFAAVYIYHKTWDPSAKAEIVFAWPSEGA